MVSLSSILCVCARRSAADGKVPTPSSINELAQWESKQHLLALFHTQQLPLQSLILETEEEASQILSIESKSHTNTQTHTLSGSSCLLYILFFVEFAIVQAADYYFTCQLICNVAKNIARLAAAWLQECWLISQSIMFIQSDISYHLSDKLTKKSIL